MKENLVQYPFLFINDKDLLSLSPNFQTGQEICIAGLDCVTILISCKQIPKNCCMLSENLAQNIKSGSFSGEIRFDAFRSKPALVETLEVAYEIIGQSDSSKKPQNWAIRAAFLKHLNQGFSTLKMSYKITLNVLNCHIEFRICSIKLTKIKYSNAQEIADKWFFFNIAHSKLSIIENNSKLLPEQPVQKISNNDISENISLYGVEKILDEIDTLIDFKFNQNSSELSSKSVLKLPSAVLLFGPPGTGKTSCAKLCAQKHGVKMVSISCQVILRFSYCLD